MGSPFCISPEVGRRCGDDSAVGMARRWWRSMEGGATARTARDEGDGECGGGRQSLSAFYRGRRGKGGDGPGGGGARH
jgi:hypothetical protein